MTGWHVDDRCTNCDVARQFAPELIAEVGGKSELLRQPQTDADLTAVHAAAYACPTRSIRNPSDGLDPGLDPFPMELDDNLFHCGHNSRQTAAANAFLLRRDTGNLMIDTPRWSPGLADRYEKLGPVTEVLLTHRDHVAHGRQYADRYGARLWIHEGDLDSCPEADVVIRGLDPVEITPGVIAHPLPGHTEGSVIFVADDKYCFTGDSFYWSRTSGDLEVAEHVTWYDIRVLAESLARTAPLIRFEWVLAGHGDRMRRPADEMAARLAGLVERAATMRPRPVDFAAHRW
ncbi:4Fe-4S domain-containing protein [Kutzneria sp. NPDC052558]|uniref:4Fe-4S domain-containing protein n=1 Tax=Kutzneria sp. NPDC052558 TaxID=3364121 RepID=UPI0037C7E1C7